LKKIYNYSVPLTVSPLLTVLKDDTDGRVIVDCPYGNTESVNDGIPQHFCLGWSVDKLEETTSYQKLNDCQYTFFLSIYTLINVNHEDQHAIA
jgi:hypothetical protein